ncbi:MAG: hypothetical protein FWC97_06080, partial [Treponema sp.]|nr:hypothetical protein [Treponema sp.]
HKNRLDLSWEAGVDAVFYWELVSAYNKNDLRIPTNFDWLRFRELFQAGTLNEEVLQDPWLVDWKSVAVRTVESGFDRRRIVPQETESVYIAIAEHLPGKWQGLWYGASPFAKPLEFEEWELPVFSVRNGINIWISSEGILRISGNNWVFLGISRKEY